MQIACTEHCERRSPRVGLMTRPANDPPTDRPSAREELTNPGLSRAPNARPILYWRFEKPSADVLLPYTD